MSSSAIAAVDMLVGDVENKKEITDRVVGLQYFSSENLRSDLLPKNLTDWVDLEVKERYKNSIIKGIIAPLLVWLPVGGDDAFLLKGVGFKLLLDEVKENYTVPEQLPCVLIECKNRADAESVALRLRSKYRKINEKELISYLEGADIDWSDLKQSVRFADISEARLETSMDLYDLDSIDEDDTEDSVVGDVIVQLGDMFLLSADGIEHRIICGDVKNDDHLELLMDGQLANAMFTDSPYNLKTSFFSGKGDVKHEDFADGGGEMTDEEFRDFIVRQMEVSKRYTVEGAIHYYCMDFRHAWHMCDAAKKAYGTYEPKQLCVWNKSNFANGSFYRAKHELVFIWRNGDAKHISHIDMKDRIRSNVWDYHTSASLANPDREELKNHPTPKPVAMYADAMLDVTNEGDMVIDWFGGSGTCIIAAQQTKRQARVSEIEPKYVQNILLRFLKYCQKQSVEGTITHLNGTITQEEIIATQI